MQKGHLKLQKEVTSMMWVAVRMAGKEGLRRKDAGHDCASLAI